MASFDNNRQEFPVLPPPIGSQEPREFYGSSDNPQPTPNQSPYLTPYLGLRARLSQVWINRWTVLLLLVLVRLLLAIASTDNGLASARREALSACTSVEQVGSAMASMPHYMSTGVNKMTGKSITKAVNGLESMVGLTITGVEELVVFYIGMLTNTYLCLTTFAVTGSLHVVIDGLEAAQKELTTMTDAIGDDLSKVGASVQKDLNGFVSGINTFLGSKIPTIDFTKQINELKDLKLPINMTDDLNKLNNSLPTFDEVKNKTEGVIRLPFEELKKLIDKSMGEYHFNDSLFPVPKKEALKFCSDDNGINDFFDKLVHLEQFAKKVFVSVLIIAAILICGPMAYWEINRFRRLQERSKLLNQATDPMDGVYMAARPTTSRLGLFFAKRFGSQRRQILARWAVAYMTSPAALFILSLGLAGLFSCFCQWLLLRAIQKEVPALTKQVANFSGMVIKKLDSASMAWADGTNGVIQSETQRLNADLLGWVGTSTEAVNNTLNTFVDETLHILNVTFGGTPLYTPIKEVFNCLIGLKIAGIEKGLTWVHDNAHISFPLLDNQTFSLTGAAQKSNDPSAQSFLADPSSGAADQISSAVARVTNGFEKAIHQEVIISTLILVVWLVVCLSGLLTALIKFGGKEKVRAEAGHDYDAPTNLELQELPRVADITAPPPSYAQNADVSAHAPYALNPHPFPRRELEDELHQEKRDSSSPEWPMGNSRGPRREPPSNYTNEKSGGFI
ncbi:putative pheromone-regulated multispanning membrane protein [Venturia nashicola]|uniref:Plasma membrane fusion protein PRM1 n=1 Tax=Venturia nashicola TaxID=86259 RepID=A0A4Z1PPN5_9PEZI|nr:putative pheromone-regulated multispanning membrane protein [Venturia nashicola]TLD36896.1 putative pheromone-regulated multispanning membrane protein [Venturia nashicola]